MAEKTAKKTVPFSEMTAKGFTGTLPTTKNTGKSVSPPSLPEDDFENLIVPDTAANDFEDFIVDGVGEPEDFGNFGDDFETFEDFDSPPQRRQEVGKDEAADKSAKSFVSIFDMGLSFGASMYSGSDRAAYKMTSEEKTDLQDSAKDYFLTVDIDVSPGIAFLVAILMILFPTVVAARQHREENETRKAYQEARAKADEEEARQPRQDGTVSEARVEAKKMRPDNDGRQQFQVDKDWLYIKSPKGQDVAKIDRKEKATPEIIDIIKDCKIRGFGIGKTNEECRKWMYE